MIFPITDETKVTFRNNLNPSENWNSWKLHKECSDNEKEEFNLASWPASCILFDKDFSDEITEEEINKDYEDFKKKLSAKGIKFYLSWKSRKGYHVLAKLKNLDKYSEEARKEINKLYISQLGCDEAKASNYGVVAIPERSHFKTGVVYPILDNIEGENELDQKILAEARHKVERNQQLKNRIQNNLSEEEFKDYFEKDPFFKFIKTTIIPDNTNRDLVVFPNIAAAAAKTGKTENEIENILHPIIEKNFPGKQWGEMRSWLRKGLNGELNYNPIQLNDWGKTFFNTEFYDLNPIIPAIDFIDESLSQKETELRERIITALILKKRNEATEEMVKTIINENNIYSTRSDENSEMWIYRDGIYVPEGKTYVKERVRRILGETYTSNFANLVVDKIETDTFIDATEFFEEKNIDEIPVQNGILNLNTRELTAFTPDKKFFQKLPPEYDPNAKCPKINEFLEEIVKYSEDIIVIKEIAGSLLHKKPEPKKASTFNGETNTGKSTALNLLKKFIGEKNCTGIPLQELEKNDFTISELQGKLANIAADISDESISRFSAFKTLTGGDLISANVKFKNKRHFVNYAKLLFSCNSLPKFEVNADSGVWSRLVLLEFPHIFLSEKEYNLCKDKFVVKKANTNLLNEITTPGELSGFLNEALDGLDRIKKQGDFSYNKSIEDVKLMWIRKSDSFAAFFMDEVEEDADSTIPKSDLWKEYVSYCKKHQLRQQGTIQIKKFLESKGSYDFRPHGDSPVWTGIKLKNLHSNHTLEQGEQGEQQVLAYIGEKKFPISK